MKLALKQRLVSLVLGLAVILSMPLVALAQDKRVEARVQNYTKSVEQPESSSALSWLLFILLAAICLSVLLMNAKRSHLD